MTELFVTRININEDVIGELVAGLNVQLANTIIAQQIIKFAHWNVKGPGFFPAHKLFDRVYEEMVEATDRIGERITALGGVAEGLPDQVDLAQKMSPYGGSAEDTVQVHIEALSNSLSEVNNGIRELANASVEKKDLVTQNLLLDITEQLDKHLYFLEAHLRG